MFKKPTYEELEQRVRELEQAPYENNITEVFFNSIFEKHNAVMLLIEPHSGDIVEANIAAQNYYGYSISTLKQMRIQEINTLTPDEIAEKRKQAANEDTNYFEFSHRLSSGEIRPVEVHSSPIIINKKRYLLSVVNDISKRKDAEKALLESEHKWRNILVNTPLIGISLDPRGRIEFANKHFLKLTGWKQTDIVGKDWFDIFIPDNSKEEIKHIFLLTINRQDAFEFSNFENEIVIKSGELRDVAWSNLVTKDLEGELVNVTCLGIDLTEKKKYQRLIEKKNTDLRLMQERYDLATEGGHVGVWDWNIETGEIFVAPHLKKMLGYEDGEIKNHIDDWGSHVHPDDADAVMQEATACLEGKKPEYRIEHRMVHKGGSTRWFLASGQVERDANGTPLRFVGTDTDITSLKDLEERLRQAQKIEALGTLSGGIAHEFNNIIGIIIGNTELAIDDVPEWSPAQDSLKEIRAASLRGKEVVRQIMSFARKTTTKLNPIDICTIIKDSLKLLRSTLPTTIEIRPEIACDYALVKANPSEIHQVLINLAQNAAHAVKDDGTGIITVGVKKTVIDSLNSSSYDNLAAGEYITLLIRDNGCGIPPEIMGSIFDPYFTTRDVDEGLGMGLSVSYGIVKKHNGTIKVTSEVDQGTVVEVVLPIIAEEPEHERRRGDELTTGTGRVLVVDDEPALVRLTTKILETHGYSVVGTTSAHDALEQFKKESADFDVVITDMSMPELPGDSLAQELMKIRPDIPIIVCTGHSDRIGQAEAEKMGITAFIHKPLSKDDLFKTVGKALDGAKSENQG